MIMKSMTAYGRARCTDQNREITVEIKSVNGRYFDCSVKLPRAYLFLEEKVKAYVQAHAITRGKVDVFITYAGETQTTLVANTEAAKQYVEMLRKLGEACGVRDDITIMGLARNPDLFIQSTEEPDVEAEWLALKKPLQMACEAYVATRKAEGEKTKQDISEKMERVMALAREAEALSRADISGYRDKLEARLRQILQDNKVTADEQRILTECAIMADKLAVDEEIARLYAHKEAFDEILREGSPCGKKLDFLLQEFNRETNTLGSKANNTRISGIVIAMKNELEKIREQIQNIE